ncbi:MAG: hypothetical protein Q8922_06480 [Bacteroidota bacterium]|nr:hypothetical protein [Bacteroidota bacterium]MDP4233805.1 hypothetical protein [Bacteroidota bacterium]MDP4242444.1 hypothetical protein [Bacteroidota bacterium]MDP4287566.1 hypothetical protein [Bacteroidota bacterium]
METTITLAANAAIALSFIVALVFGLAQVRAAARDRRERLTLETIRNFQTREFAELLQSFSRGTMYSTRDDFYALPSAEQVLFIQLSQEMESLGILVAEGLIDLDLVDKTLGSFVSTAWEKSRPAILDMREKNPDPYLAEYFQWLAERIDTRMRENPRPPYFENHA